MTFTYDETDLSTDLAKVRATIGDVVEHDHYSVSDEEIQRHIDATSSLAQVYYLAQRDRYNRAVIYSSRSAAGVNADRSSVVNALKESMQQLAKDAGVRANLAISAGMMSQDSIDTAKADTDYPDPPFRIGMDDNPHGVTDESDRTDG